jgi:hypothetical protein
VNKLITGASRMMTAGIAGKILADVYPARLEEAKLNYQLALDAKIKEYRDAKKDPSVLLTPGTPEYFGEFNKVISFLPDPKEMIAREAAKGQATRQITGAPPLERQARPTYPTAVNPQTGETLILKEGKWQKP